MLKSEFNALCINIPCRTATLNDLDSQQLAQKIIPQQMIARITLQVHKRTQLSITKSCYNAAVAEGQYFMPDISQLMSPQAN